MSVSSFGFERDTFEEIIDRLATQLLNAMPDITLTPDNPIYQLMKIYASEIMRLEVLLEEAYKNMTVIGASGVWLRAHGIESGVVIKPPSYSHGTVTMNGPVPTGNLLVPVNTSFFSADNREYVSYEEIYIPKKFTLDINGEGEYEMDYNAIPLNIIINGSISLVDAQYSVSDNIITFYDIGTPTDTFHSIDSDIPNIEPTSGDKIIVTSDLTKVSKYQIVSYDALSGEHVIGDPTNNNLYSDGSIYKYYVNYKLYDVTSGYAVNGVIKDDTSYSTASSTAGDYFVYRYNNSTVSAGNVYTSDGVGGFTLKDTNFTEGSVVSSGSMRYVMSDYVWYECDTGSPDATVSAFTDNYYYNNSTQYMIMRDWIFKKNYIYTYGSGYYINETMPTIRQTVIYDSKYYVYYNDEWTIYNQTDYTSSTAEIEIDTVKFDIKVRSSMVGSIGNIPLYKINTCPSFPDFEVYNQISFLNGTDTEDDDSYRKRILHAKRANFNTWSIMEKLYESPAIKKVNVVPTLGTDINLNASDTNYYNKSFTFEFTPSKGVVTLKGLTFIVGGKGKPDNVTVELYKLNSGLTGFEPDGDLLYSKQFSYNDLLEYPASTTIAFPVQELSVGLKYDSLTQNTVYAVKVIMPTGNDTNTTDYWNIYKADSDSGTDIACYDSDGVLGIRPAFSTKYGTNAYRIYYVKTEGYDDDTVLEIIDGKLNPENGYGFEPMGTVRFEEEATKVYVNLYTEINIDSRYDQMNIRDTIINNINKYIDNLYLGDNINYSKIEQIILDVGGVNRAMNTKISINGNPYIDSNASNDLIIHDHEYAELNINGNGDWTLNSTNLKGVEVKFV